MYKLGGQIFIDIAHNSSVIGEDCALLGLVQVCHFFKSPMFLTIIFH